MCDARAHANPAGTTATIASPHRRTLWVNRRSERSAHNAFSQPLEGCVPDNARGAGRPRNIQTAGDLTDAGSLWASFELAHLGHDVCFTAARRPSFYRGNCTE